MEKLALVKLHKQMLEMEIAHKQKIYALEIENMIDENKFKAELREKELKLLDIKIKKYSN